MQAHLSAAYPEAGGYVSTHAGVRSYHAATLRQAALHVCAGHQALPERSPS